MKNIFTSLFIILFSFSFLNSQPTLEWEARFNGSSIDDVGKDIIKDDDGNIYVTGYSDGANGRDFMTIKYNSSGEEIWAKRFNGPGNGNDEPVAIAIDAFNNIYVSGKSKSENNGYDIATVKYNSQGVQQWAVFYNGEDNKDDIGYDMKCDAYGNTYVCGSINSQENSDKSGIVLKYSTSGILLWESTPNRYYYYNKLLINQFGNIVVSGVYDLESKYILNEMSSESGEIFYNYESCFSFYHHLPGSSNKPHGIVEEIVLDNIGNITIVSTAQYYTHAVFITHFKRGQSNPSWFFYEYYGDYTDGYIYGVDIKIDNENKTYALIRDFNNFSKYKIIKFNSSGEKLWDKNYFSQTGVDEFPVALELSNVDSLPDLYISGYTALGKIRTFKTNTEGDVLWDEIYDCGINGQDIASAMIMDKCENIYITGSSSCDLTHKDIKTIKYSNLEKPVITITGDSLICSGGQVTLSTPQCDGCTYMWSSGQTSSSIVVSPTETTEYRVTVTNSNQCSSSSYPFEITVIPILTPAVNLASDNSIICQGEIVTFTASPVNGGTSPTYDWYIDGVKKVTGGLSTYSSATLSNGAVITCVMHSNTPCITSEAVTSNPVSITVNPKLSVSIHISTPKTTICEGNLAIFTATVVNEGTNPEYNWYVNNQLQSESSNQFSTNSLTNGDKVYATLKSSVTCPDPATAVSNNITMTITKFLTPSVTIASSSNSICKGENVTFTASPVNGGTTPAYKWYVGNNLQQETSNIFSTDQLSAGNQVYCILTSSEECTTVSTATSNYISVAINPLVTPVVSIDASSTNIFSCENITFTATPTNGGTSPQYKWFVNGNVVSTSVSFSTTTLLDGAQVYCEMTSNANCISINTVKSGILNISVSTLPQPEILFSNDTILIENYSGDQYSYSWYFNGNLVSSAPYLICQENGTGSYYVVVSLNNCETTSTTINITCTTGTYEINKELKFALFPNPADQYIQIEGINLIRSKYSIQLYNIYGIRINEKTILVNDDIMRTKYDVESIPYGNYYIIIKGENYYQVLRFQKM